MTISNIQKEKFLSTLYKNLYAAGNKPKESEILDFFSKYFSKFQPGQPLPIDSQIFRQVQFGEVDLLNQKMLYSIFNIETLYDSMFENSDQMLEVATALNKRLQNLRAKRIFLESKVDDLIFANQNSDGFYAAYSELFSKIDGTDLGYTTAFVDIINGKVSLPTLKSSVFDMVSTNSITSNSPTYSLSFNKTQIDLNKAFSDDSFFSAVFDGLENTEWQTIRYFDKIGLVTLSINLPIAKNVILSKIEGRLSTISPTDVYVKVNYVDTNKNSQVYSKKSTKDFDRFSFSFEPGNIGSIDLFMVKTEPDFIEPNRVDKNGYRFGIRDIAISGQYYDRSATYVSMPISVSSKDNPSLVIDSVSLDVDYSTTGGGSIIYYLAEDNPSAQVLSDFAWIPILPTGNSNLELNEFSNSINFNGSTLASKQINANIIPNSGQIKKIPLATKSSSKNLNDQNPLLDMYPGQKIYRIGKIDKLDQPIRPYLLEGVNLVNGNYINYIGSIFNEKDELFTWANILNGKSSIRQFFTMPSYELTNSSIFFTGPNLSKISVLLDVKIYCPNDITVRNNFIKNDTVSKTWDVAIYLNGRSSIIPVGKNSEMIQWNFKAGINVIRIAIDMPESSNGSITLMDSKSLLEYGLVYNKYYSYVDPLEFKNNNSLTDLVFTLENFFGNKEIFCRDNIRSNSRFFYYTNNPEPVSKVRFRADLVRGQNPLGSPSIDSFKIKFKNSEKFSDASRDIL